MSFILDSSAIINLCGDRKAEELLDGWTLNLAIYELGSAVWKHVRTGEITVRRPAYCWIHWKEFSGG